MPKSKEFLIAIDGGGTKTEGVLIDLRGKILKRIKTSSSNPNKVGLERSISVLKNLISDLSKKRKIKLAFLGLAGGLERDFGKRKKIEKKLKTYFKFPIIVEGDQKIGFLAGTDEEDGVLVISGTGSISMGWRGEKEEICGGWDWLLGDQGSAFWIGKRALEKVLSILDKREKEETILKDLIFKKFKIKKEADFYQKFYGRDFVEKIASISKLVDYGAKKGDKISIQILKEAGKELSKMAVSVIKNLKFEKETFPLVLVGSTFRSKILFSEFKKEVKKVAKKAKIIFPSRPPIFGAIKLVLKKHVNFGN